MKERANLVVVLIAATSLVFWREVRDSFDLTKATLLWILAVPIWVTSLLQAFGTTRGMTKFRDHHWLILPSALFVAAVMSPRLGYAIVGQPSRFTGLLTLGSCLAVGIAVMNRPTAKTIGIILSAYSFVAIPISSYVLVQAAGKDPFEWAIVSFGTPVFGTIGNPNSASGFLSVCALMALWALHQIDSRPFIRYAAAVSLGFSVAAIPLLVSFQGQAVVVVGSVFLLVWTISTLSIAQSLFWIRAALGSLIVVAVFLPSRVLVGVVVAVGVSLLASLSVWVDSRERREDFAFKGAQVKKAVLVLVPAAVVILASPVGRQIASGFADGFIERGDFYRAAWSLFKDKPLFGGGLENFGFDFPRFRPEGHAISLENSRTSSVHSIPLAMLSSGGIVLGGAYLAFVSVVSARFVQSCRRSGWLSPKAFWLGVLWLGVNLQSLVSIEHVSLYLQFFLVASVVEIHSRRERLVHGIGRSRSNDPRKSVHLVGGIALAALLSIPLSRPFRANSLVLDATFAINRGESFESALEKYRQAVDLSPWDLYYRYELGFILTQSGNLVEGAEVLKRAAEDANYLASYALPAAAALAQNSQLEESAQVLMKAVENDPYAPSLRSQSADFLTQMGDAYVDIGDLEQARIFYDRAISVLPAWQPALDALARLQ